MCGDFADEFWREAREGAGVCNATELRRALPADLAEIVHFCSRILAGKVSGARLNDTQRNFKTCASGFHGIVLAQLAFAGVMTKAVDLRLRLRLMSS